MLNPARFVRAEPSVFCVGALQLTVALPFATCVTMILNAASDAVDVPSLTLMMMFE